MLISGTLSLLARAGGGPSPDRAPPGPYPAPPVQDEPEPGRAVSSDSRRRRRGRRRRGRGRGPFGRGRGPSCGAQGRLAWTSRSSGSVRGGGRGRRRRGAREGVRAPQAGARRPHCMRARMRARPCVCLPACLCNFACVCSVICLCLSFCPRVRSPRACLCVFEEEEGNSGLSTWSGLSPRPTARRVCGAHCACRGKERQGGREGRNKEDDL